MDPKLLGFLLGIGGILAAFPLGGVPALVATAVGLGGFSLSAYGFLKKKDKLFQPKDPYDFYWRPIIILAVVLVLGLYVVKEVL